MEYKRPGWLAAGVPQGITLSPKLLLLLADYVWAWELYKVHSPLIKRVSLDASGIYEWQRSSASCLFFLCLPTCPRESRIKGYRDRHIQDDMQRMLKGFSIRCCDVAGQLNFSVISSFFIYDVSTCWSKASLADFSVLHRSSKIGDRPTSRDAYRYPIYRKNCISLVKISIQWFSYISNIDIYYAMDKKPSLLLFLVHIYLWLVLL